MYKVRPYFVIRKVKLPDCMYLLRSLHKLPSLTGDEEDYKRALDNLEYRQQVIFSCIKEIQETVIKTAQNVGLSQGELQELTESYVPEGNPIDIVITCPPTSPPYSLLGLYPYINKSIPTCIKTHVHSSAIGKVSKELLASFSSCESVITQAKLKITIIWKEDVNDSDPSMILTPNKQIPVSGIANICRFLSRRFCPEIYESFDPKISAQIDTWLDSLSLSYIHGNAKEKGAVLRRMNSSLGSAEFLTGNTLTLADVVLFCVLGNERGIKIGGNVKKWMKHCHNVTPLVSVSCFYLNE